MNDCTDCTRLRTQLEEREKELAITHALIADINAVVPFNDPETTEFQTRVDAVLLNCENGACLEYQRLEAELGRLRTAQGAQGWQSMTTAPKDFTPVLLRWQPPVMEHVRNHRPEPCVVLDRWYCGTHAHSSRHCDCPNEPDCKIGWGGDGYAGEMTGWMPLPDVAEAVRPAQKEETK